MKSFTLIALLSLLSTLTTAAVLPAEHTSAELIERDDATSASTTDVDVASVNSANITDIDVECNGCPPPPNYERWGVRPFSSDLQSSILLTSKTHC